MKFQRRNTYKHLVTIVLAFVCVLVLYQALRAYINMRQVSRQRDELTEKIQKLENEIAENREKIKSLESGAGIELEAKGRLNLQKPEERVLIIVDKSHSAGNATSSNNTSWWTKVKVLFGVGK